MNLRKEFRKQTGNKLPMTRTLEAYLTYYKEYSEWLETQLKKCNMHDVSVSLPEEKCNCPKCSWTLDE